MLRGARQDRTLGTRVKYQESSIGSENLAYLQSIENKCKNRIEVTEVHSNYVRLKLKDYYSFNNLMGNTNHLNICAIHIPPETSPYFSGHIFDNFRDDINTFSNCDNPLMICGDLNARNEFARFHLKYR